jgi:protein-S-isoprenylcysteine O-methyltransferase Ste14
VTPHGIVTILWFGFVALWIIAATTAKRTVNRRRMRTELGIRLLIVGLVIIAVRTPSIQEALIRLQRDTPRSLAVQWLGVAICAAGVGLAIAARIQLGRNWGMPATLKENPELITSGPYRVIRHPIYTGILLAAAGTALAESLLWLLALVAAGVYFVIAARREEHLMAEQFPDQYPAYMRRTKMLIPFLL